MKQVLFLLSAGLLLARSAQAQWGVRAGGNAPIFTKGDGANLTTSRQLGYQAGLFCQVPLTEHLSLVPEMQLSYERFYVDRPVVLRPMPFAGIAIDYVDNSLGYNYSQSLTYLNLPVLLRASVGPLYLEAGPQVNLLIAGRADGTQAIVDASGGTQYVAIDRKATDMYRRFDAGPCVGVGIKLPAGLGVGVRSYWGLTKLTADGSYSAPTYAGFEHRQSLQASLTYQLAAH